MDNAVEVIAKIDTSDLAQLAQNFGAVPALKDGIEAAGIYAKGWIAEYPPMSEANVAGPYPKQWYIRGTGNFWALKNGGFHFNHSSRTLGRRWTTQTIDQGLGVVIGNNAPYAAAVHDRESQPDYHKRRGWKTVQDFVETQSKHVREIIADFIWARISKKES